MQLTMALRLNNESQNGHQLETLVTEENNLLKFIIPISSSLSSRLGGHFVRRLLIRSDNFDRHAGTCGRPGRGSDGYRSEIARLLRPGGWSAHVIGMDDHRDSENKPYDSSDIPMKNGKRSIAIRISARTAADE